MADKTAVDLDELGYTPTPVVGAPWSVAKALEQLPGGAPSPDATSPVPFFHMLERLKTTKREGWRRFGINRGESISDHMYRMSILTLVCPPTLAPRLDLPRCTKMCLVHDMAELLVGDITPVDGVPKAEKSRREAETMDFLTSTLLRNVAGGGDAGASIRAVWQEYEDGQTLESQFVHDIDKMELLLQMVEYERRGEGQLDLGEFTYVASKMVLDETRAWGQEVIREREAFWDEKGRGRARGADDGLRKMQDQYYGRQDEDDWMQA